MLKISIVFIVNLSLWSCNIMADTKYRGLISANVVEQNGHVYRGYEGFSDEGMFEDIQIIYFSQVRGQKLTLTKKKILIDNSKAHKYHMIVNIIDRKNDMFKAELSFYHNSMVYDQQSQDYVLVSKIIKKTRVEGELNTENNFTFINDNKPNLIVSINIDRIFKKEEILAKLKKKLAVNSK